jgi:hypothetical protein
MAVLFLYHETPQPLRVRLMRSLRHRLQAFCRIFRKKGIDVTALIA